jgi:hypothetical protein
MTTLDVAPAPFTSLVAMNDVDLGPSPAPSPEAPAPRTYYLHPDRVGKVQKKLEGLLRLCAKLGVTPPTVEYRAPEWTHKDGRPVDVFDVFGGGALNETMFHQRVPVTVSHHEPIRLGGWEVIGTKRRIGPSALVAKIPTSRTDWAPAESAWTDGFACEHCWKVRDRHQVVYLRNAAGKVIQVGKACLVDFLGHPEAEAIARLGEFSLDAPEWVEEWGEYSGGPIGFNLVSVLAETVAQVRDYGFVSRTVAREDGRASTADIVEGVMYGRVVARATAADQTTALEAVAWCKALVASSDYERNLQACLSSPGCTSRELGIVCSLIVAWQRATLTAEQRAARAARPAPAEPYVGKVGDKVRFKARVVKRIPMEGAYGCPDLYILEDREGHIFKWKASDASLEEGDYYVLAGTVRAHEMYKGTPQTVLTRCSVIE